ncbi:hypothetical protein WEI85_22165 [Actinomycetes bacterium KLBMP 9797]
MVSSAWALPLAATVAAVVTVSTGTVVSAAPAAPPTACAIERLEESKTWSMSIVTGGDPTGAYIAGRGYPADPHGDFTRYPVIWQNGKPTAVDVPGIDQRLDDVNASGAAVATGYDPNTWEPMRPWLYTGGRLLPLRGVDSGEALGLNNRGDVVGVSQSPVVGPVWWPVYSTGAGPVQLPMPDGALSARAYDIDEDGTIVGTYTDKEGVDHGLVWLPGGQRFKELPLPKGYGPMSAAYTIRNGWITGLTGGDTGLVGLRWHLPTGEAKVYPQFDIRPSEANAQGWLVGSDLSGRGLFVSEGGDLRLPGLAEPATPLGDIATTLSDDGRTIGGQATDKEGQLRAVRWTCA